MIAHIPDLCCQQYLTGAEFTLILDADVNMRKQQKCHKCCADEPKTCTQAINKRQKHIGSYRNRRVAGLLTWEGDDTPEVG
jgi:hypothetical protein